MDKCVVVLKYLKYNDDVGNKNMPIDQPQQSFVPKKPISGQNKKAKVPPGLFFGVSFIIFILTIGSAVSVYFYKTYKEKKIENMKVSLELAKKAFEPSLIIELKQLDARIKSANEILNKHIAFSEFFDFLEDNTLKTIQFNRFAYSEDGDEGIRINLSGKAKSYSSIALQSDIFGENKFIKNPIFSGLKLDEKGDIIFDVVADVDKQLVLYKESIKNKEYKE